MYSILLNIMLSWRFRIDFEFDISSYAPCSASCQKSKQMANSAVIFWKKLKSNATTYSNIKMSGIIHERLQNDNSESSDSSEEQNGNSSNFSFPSITSWWVARELLSKKGLKADIFCGNPKFSQFLRGISLKLSLNLTLRKGLDFAFLYCQYS